MLTGCLADDRYARTVDDYALAAHGVDLGMTPAQVANILQPTQDRLEQHARRSPEQYISNGQELRIEYYRSGWQAEGRLTDDEYTPYLFKNGRLIAYGWQALRASPDHPHAANFHWVQIIAPEQRRLSLH